MSYQEISLRGRNMHSATPMPKGSTSSDLIMLDRTLIGQRTILFWQSPSLFLNHTPRLSISTHKEFYSMQMSSEVPQKPHISLLLCSGPPCGAAIGRRFHNCSQRHIHCSMSCVICSLFVFMPRSVKIGLFAMCHRCAKPHSSDYMRRLFNTTSQSAA